jgi:hypothetical protein
MGVGASEGEILHLGNDERTQTKTLISGASPSAYLEASHSHLRIHFVRSPAGTK